MNKVVGGLKGMRSSIVLEETNFSDRGNYRDYYSSESMKIVEDLHSRGVSEFGYCF